MARRSSRLDTSTRGACVEALVDTMQSAAAAAITIQLRCTGMLAPFEQDTEDLMATLSVRCRLAVDLGQGVAPVHARDWYRLKRRPCRPWNPALTGLCRSIAACRRMLVPPALHQAHGHTRNGWSKRCAAF